MRKQDYMCTVSALLQTISIACALTAAAGAQTATQIIDRVEQVSGISKSGPFMLSAGLYQGKKLIGSYQLWWDEGKWNDELTWGAFSEKRVGKDASIYIARGGGIWSPEMFLVRELIPVSYSPWSATAKKVQTKKFKGKKVSCIEFDDTRHSQMCFEESDGKIAGNDSYTFADFQIFDGKLVPRRIVSNDISIIIEKLEKLDASTPPDISSEFKGPFSGCYQPTIPLLKENLAHPSYPQEAKSSRIQGESYVYAAIDSNGTVSATLALHAGQQIFSAGSQAAVRYWKYEPAKCGTVPVPYEKVETIHFKLAP
jgi:hypothetical protein